MEASDRVTVLRKGKVISTVDTSAVTPRELARMMVGREVEFQLTKTPMQPGATLLQIRDLCVRDNRGIDVLQKISLDLHRNEILGVAGVSGNGQRELFEVLTGSRKATSGHVALENKDITNRSPSYIASNGVASVPEDRMHRGLVMNFRVDENLILGFQRKAPFSRGGFLNQGGINAFARKAIDSYDIATPSPRQITRVLSGGNLQKVILARELSQGPKCLIISQPTRGLDVGATEYVRKRLLEERDRGAGILLISEDLDEVFNLATRIAVMFKGRMVGLLDADKATREEVGLLMAGCEVAV
jgi:general nucleoside transport system ATP-binding protein